MKVVLNKRFGGFGISDEAWRYILDRGYTGQRWDIPRNLPALVEAVETMDKRAFAEYTVLVVEDVDDGWNGSIRDYDGRESLNDYDPNRTVKLISQREFALTDAREWLRVRAPELVVEFEAWIKTQVKQR